ncbi:MAG TPA: apolipoprotein N-acyltransferase [Planktothrix sp.]|jgi:apolipoprotein N-acyltransferase
MPTIAQSKKKRKKDKRAVSAEHPSGGSLWKSLPLALAGGVVLGLSAPGINQWYLAWVGLVPLLLLIGTSNGARQACLRGLFFGLGYHLVYGSWFLNLQPLDWLGFGGWVGCLMAAGAWLILCSQQAVITAIFAFVCRIIPMNGGFLLKKATTGFTLPALLVIPLLWVLIHNFICNAHDLMGVPWSELEYTQYKQITLIQAASIIGGVGIGFLLVMFNTALATLCASIWKQLAIPMLASANREQAYYQLLFTGFLFAMFVGLGVWQSHDETITPTLQAAILQGNINIDMQKTKHRYTLEELWAHYNELAQQVPPESLCVMTESALPVYLRQEPEMQNTLKTLARQRQLDIIVGALDQDTLNHPYNAAYGVSSDGNVLTEIYHKRYLVPFGEYCPWLVEYLPAWVKRLTNTPAGGGFTSGKQPTVLKLEKASVSPLICFETLSPELASSSVRAGGQLLVNISDLAWFHRSIAGDQMIAFSVMRAVENRRYFIFAANTGPSVIIDNDGNIQDISNLDKACIVLGKVGLGQHLSPFTRWFAL